MDGGVDEPRPAVGPEQHVAPPQVAVEQGGTTGREQLPEPVDDRLDDILQATAGGQLVEPMTVEAGAARASTPGRRGTSRSTKSHHPTAGRGCACSRASARPRDSSWAGVGATWSIAVVTRRSSSASTTSGTGGAPGTSRSCSSPAASSREPGPTLTTSARPDTSTLQALAPSGTTGPAGPRARERRRVCQGITVSLLHSPPYSGRRHRAPRGGGSGNDGPMTVRRVAGLVLTPGASAGRDHSGLVAIDRAVTPLGIAVDRVEFPGRAEGRRRPDPPAVCIQTVRSATSSLAERLSVPVGRVAVGGRSFGGRMCSMAVAEGLQPAALVLVSYPAPPAGAARSSPDRAFSRPRPGVPLRLRSARCVCHARGARTGDRRHSGAGDPRVRGRRSLVAQEGGRRGRHRRRLAGRAHLSAAEWTTEASTVAQHARPKGGP